MEVLSVNAFEFQGTAPQIAVRDEKKKDDDIHKLLAAGDTVSISDEARERLRMAESGESGDKSSGENGAGGEASADANSPGSSKVDRTATDGTGATGKGEGEDGGSRVAQIQKQIQEVQKKLADANDRLAEAGGSSEGDGGSDVPAELTAGGNAQSGAQAAAQGASQAEGQANAQNAAQSAQASAPSLGGGDMQKKVIMQEIQALTGELLQLQQELQKAMKEGDASNPNAGGGGGGYVGEGRGAMGFEISRGHIGK